MIWQFNVQIVFGIYTEEEWKATIEILSNSRLHDLHLAIQDAVKFDNDHLYEFYISKTEKSQDRIRFDDEDEGIYDTTLNSLFPLNKGKKLFYMFDYCDCWLFKITKINSNPLLPKEKIKYPRVVAETGYRPKQYRKYEEEVA